MPRYAVPPPSPTTQRDAATATGADPALTELYANDTALLERLTPRKKLRRSRDIVRLSSGHIDERLLLAFDAPWFGGSATESSDAEGGAAAAAASDSSLDDAEEEDADESAESDTGDEDEDGNASDGDVAVEVDVVEHVNTDGNEDTAPRNKRKRNNITPSSSPTHVDDPVRPTKKTVSFAALPPSRSSPRTATVTAAVAAADKKQMAASGTKMKKAMTGRMWSLAAQGGAAARRTGSTKPAANAPTAAQKRKKQDTAAAVSEEAAYDFSKFF